MLIIWLNVQGDDKMHVILENAKIYYGRTKKTHKGYSYNTEDGFWESDSLGEAMVLSNELEDLVTKKEDIETGEDQKGE